MEDKKTLNTETDNKPAKDSEKKPNVPRSSVLMLEQQDDYLETLADGKDIVNYLKRRCEILVEKHGLIKYLKLESSLLR